MSFSSVSHTQNDTLLRYNWDTITFFSVPLSDDLSIRDSISIEHISIYDLENSYVQLQTNGPGSLITPFIHGLGARHTAVIWQGLNIQSPVNGTVDLNLIAGFDRILVSPSSISAFSGSAGLSGALYLEEDQLDKFQLNINYGNTENADLGLSKMWKNQKNLGFFKVDYIHHNNEYKYRNQAETLTQDFADFKGINIKTGWNHHITDNLKISTNFWWQNFRRSIAPSKTSKYNQAKQYDKNFRAHLGINFINTQFNLGILSEGLEYEDASVYSNARTKSIIANIAHDFRWFDSFLSYKKEAVDATFYSEHFVRNTYAAQLAKKISLGQKLKTNIVLRSEVIDDYRSPLLYLLSTKYDFSDGFWMKMSMDKSYNIPTFNDLYWPTGGNPDLRPEQAVGVNLETSIAFENISMKALTYAKKVQDWIVWVPGPVFWSPANQRNVMASGFDFFTSITMRYSGIDILIAPHFHYNHTTITEDDKYPDFIGNQIIYVPKTRWGSSISLTRGKWKFMLNYSVFGERYISFDNEEILKGFNLLDLSFNYNIDEHFIFSLDLDNVFNKDYERVAFYAMPLRNINFGIKATL